MNIQDLQHIFRPQIQEGTKKLYFMLIEGSHVQIERHPVNQLEELVPMLSNFQFEGYKPGNMARFVK
jgi:hypothetical protein